MLKASVAVAALFVAACGGGDEAGGPVSVAKSLGSVQCAGGGITLPEMQSQLTGAGVQVLAASCGNDGVGHPAVCGASDGAIGIFDIPASQQAAAQALAFAPLSTLPHATREACR